MVEGGRGCWAGGRVAFFGVGVAVGALREGFGPGDGEGVGGPEADGGDGEEDVLAWFYGTGACEPDVNAHGVAGEDFDGGGGGCRADVRVQERKESEEALGGPDDGDGYQVIKLGEAI